MAKKMLIDATHPEETRVVVADGTKVEEFDFESLNKRQLAGNIYLAKVTRVEPSLQAAFIDYGGNRHGFLAFSEIHPDYYQIPVADREALLAEERALAEAQARDEEEAAEKPKRRRSRSRRGATQAEETHTDAVARGDASGMDVIDLDDEGDDASEEGLSPMELVKDTPVEEPEGDTSDDVEDVGDATTATAEVVADDDTEDDIRPVRKPRVRKYKIQEVVKVRQIMLVQVVKEERGNKGAALTTYLSLAGRYCVLMPNTARGGGISRKITNAADRKKLKDIAVALDVPQGAGLIVRTAGAQRTKTEIKRDYEYLQRQWEQVRTLTLNSIAPAAIYQEGDLIHRTIRDLYTRDIDEVLVEGEAGYRHAKEFMKMIMPSHAKNVKQWTDPMPIFSAHKVEGYLGDMFNPTVQLKSGGYIVIGVTEALVAIDVNSGRATKEGSIEETATKTNLEAAEEVARQVRLRDLAGLIVIDFIDMDERRNNAAVEKRIKDKLKSDRARIQVGRISAFGLMEMSRQRLRPGMLEATTQACHHCHGTGLVRSDDSLALSILRQLEEEGTRGRSKEVLLVAPTGIVNFLINHKRDYLDAIEARTGMAIRIEADPGMIVPDYKVEKFKTATRKITAVASVAVSMDASLMDDIDDADLVEEDEDEDEAIVPAATASSAGPARAPAPAPDLDEDGQPRKKRRRRRGGRGRRRTNGDEAEDGSNGDGSGAEYQSNVDAGAGEPGTGQSDAEAEGDGPSARDDDDQHRKRRRSRRGGRGRKPGDAGDADTDTDTDTEGVPTGDAAAQPKVEPAESVAAAQAPESVAADVVAEAQPEPEPEPERTPDPVAVAAPEPAAEPAPAPAPEAATPPQPMPDPEPVAADSDKPKRRGWWSRG